MSEPETEPEVPELPEEPATPEEPDTPEQPPTGTTRLTTPAVIAALFALAALAAFTIYMIIQADTDSEVTWARLAWLFSSVEAIAFAAAGALFGASVHRQRAEKAESEAREYAGDAARGRALAAALKADDDAGDGEAATRGLGGGDDEPSVRARHARIARELFP
jgi:hypothetical protein